MEYKPYSEYEEPKIESIQKIPAHWIQKKFRFLFTFGRGLGITKSDLVDKGIPCINYGEIHSKYGFEVIPEIQDLKCVAENYIDESPASLLNNGDFIFADTSEDIEGSGNFSYLNSDTPTFAGYHTVIARPTGKESSRFLAYFFDSLVYRSQIRKSVSGVKVFSVTQNILKNSYVWLPPLEEQQKIAAFLDYKTQQIDQLIAKKKALIEKLEEKRIAVITQAVTKGLDKNVKLKPSGVDWLGDVPEHWDVIKLAHAVRMKSGENITSLQIQPAGTYPVYGGNGIRGFFEEYTHEGNFVLIGRQGALCGNVKLVNETFWASEHAVVVTPDRGLILEWMYYLLFAMNLNQYSVSAAQPGLSVEMISKLKVPFPSIIEQKEISSFIKRNEASIEPMIRKTRGAISKLEEYRSAIITSAVTGKIDVRDIEIPREVA